MGSGPEIKARPATPMPPPMSARASVSALASSPQPPAAKSAAPAKLMAATAKPAAVIDLTGPPTKAPPVPAGVQITPRVEPGSAGVMRVRAQGRAVVKPLPGTGPPSVPLPSPKAFMEPTSKAASQDTTGASGKEYNVPRAPMPLQQKARAPALPSGSPPSDGAPAAAAEGSGGSAEATLPSVLGVGVARTELDAMEVDDEGAPSGGSPEERVRTMLRDMGFPDASIALALSAASAMEASTPDDYQQSAVEWALTYQLSEVRLDSQRAVVLPPVGARIRFPHLQWGQWYRAKLNTRSSCKAYRGAPGGEYAFTLRPGEIFGPTEWSEDDPHNYRRAVMVPNPRGGNEMVFITVWSLYNSSGVATGVWFAERIHPPGTPAGSGGSTPGPGGDGPGDDWGPEGGTGDAGGFRYPRGRSRRRTGGGVALPAPLHQTRGELPGAVSSPLGDRYAPASLREAVRRLLRRPLLQPLHSTCRSHRRLLLR